MVRRIYIAGPISSLKHETAWDAFEKKEKELSKLGVEVYNPMKLVAEENKRRSKTNEPILDDFETRHLTLKYCAHKLLECDTIYLMRGWQESVGAMKEYRLAIDFGMQIM